jgi:hypothetical protein
VRPKALRHDEIQISLHVICRKQGLPKVLRRDEIQISLHAVCRMPGRLYNAEK